MLIWPTCVSASAIGPWKIAGRGRGDVAAARRARVETAQRLVEALGILRPRLRIPSPSTTGFPSHIVSAQSRRSPMCARIWPGVFGGSPIAERREALRHAAHGLAAAVCERRDRVAKQRALGIDGVRDHGILVPWIVVQNRSERQLSPPSIFRNSDISSTSGLVATASRASAACPGNPPATSTRSFTRTQFAAYSSPGATRHDL